MLMILMLRMLILLAVLLPVPIATAFYAAKRHPERFIAGFDQRKQLGAFSLIRVIPQGLAVLEGAFLLSLQLPGAIVLVILCCYAWIGNVLASNLAYVLAEATARRRLPPPTTVAPQEQVMPPVTAQFLENCTSSQDRAPAASFLAPELPRIDVLKAQPTVATQVLHQFNLNASDCRACYVYGPGMTGPLQIAFGAGPDTLANLLGQGIVLRGPKIAAFLTGQARLEITEALWEVVLQQASGTHVLFIGPSLLSLSPKLTQLRPMRAPVPGEPGASR